MEDVDEFDIVCNKQSLEYYSFLRQAIENNQLNYWIGNPSVQITNGILYLKQSLLDNIEINDCRTYESLVQKYQNKIQIKKEKQKEREKNENNKIKDTQEVDNSSFKQKNEDMSNRILLLMGISNKKSPVQVLNRLQPYHQWIAQAKVLKTSHFKYYAMYLLFKNQKMADSFYADQFGHQYSSLQVERIILRYVVEITIFSTGANETDIQKLLYLKGLPSLGERIPADTLFTMTRKTSTNPSKILTDSPKKKQSTKENGKQNCPICFEETEGVEIISILCQHFFHFKCLAQWKQNTCPMCRYHQHPPLISFCDRCNQCEGLWVCLICGSKLCCGSDHNILGQESHIYAHYKETQHRLSIQAETKFIFDAQQLAFLHHMFYRQIMKDEPEEIINKSKKGKIGELISDYEQNISEQMRRQRKYFEQSINNDRKKQKQIISQKKRMIQQLQDDIVQLDSKNQQTDIQNIKLEADYIGFQKQLEIIMNLQKIWRDKAKANTMHIASKQSQNQKIIQNLKRKIAQKQQELKDYHKNLQLTEKIKKNLHGEKIQANFFLGGIQTKKKKK